MAAHARIISSMHYPYERDCVVVVHCGWMTGTTPTAMISNQ